MSITAKKQLDTATPDIAESTQIETISTYKVGGKTFIVEPRFKESGTETICTILFRLMKLESDETA